MPLIRFRKKIKVNAKESYFTFYGLPTINGRRFLIAVEDEKLFTVLHMVENGRATWKLVADAPDWAMEIQDKLSNIIQSELA
jgi:hypothetical protein